VFAFGGLMLGERVGPNAVIGAVLALAGVAAISLNGDMYGAWPYIGATLGAAAVSAYANVVLKQHAATDPFRTLPPAMFAAGVAMTLAGSIFEHPDLHLALEPRSVAAILYLAIPGSGIAFSLNHWLLHRLEAWVVGLSALVIPVIAVAVGALAGGESFGWRELGGAALVLAGVWLALRAPRRVSVPEIPC
jgi:drug/metabolite transporter (DMT)-like permease